MLSVVFVYVAIRELANGLCFFQLLVKTFDDLLVVVELTGSDSFCSHSVLADSAPSCLLETYSQALCGSLNRSCTWPDQSLWYGFCKQFHRMAKILDLPGPSDIADS